MKAPEWRERIKQACEDAGTYRPYFEDIIDALAGILEMRDNAREKFESTGGNTVVAHTNKGGATNIVKNPAMVSVLDLNSQALAFWRELGLTPSGLRKLNEQAMQPPKKEIRTGRSDRAIIRR